MSDEPMHASSSCSRSPRSSQRTSVTLDIEYAHRAATATAELVQNIATRVHEIAAQVGRSDPAFTDLAATAQALANVARTANTSIDTCLALQIQCVGTNTLAALQTSQLELAGKWLRTLERTLNAVCTIYAQACRALADRAAIAEEHRVSQPTAGESQLRAASLANAARALSQATTHPRT
jgi:hypothetical protein